MDNENNIRCKEIANVAFGQLFWSIDKWTYFSWGVMKKAYLMYKNMPTLALRCSALIHKGWVYISLDESTDTYVITLLNTAKEVVRTREDVYCDCLGEIIEFHIFSRE